MLRCPQGHVPLKTGYCATNGTCRALFAKTCCANCPLRERCKAKEQKKNFAVMVSQKMADRANCLLKMTTDEYQSLARQRNAVEGIPSVLRRKYHIDDIPTYGKLRSKFFIVCKVLAYNFNKVRACLRRQRDNCTLLPVGE